MKHLKTLILFLLISSTSFAQIMTPRHWSFRAEHLKGNEYNLIFTMAIDKPWHGYSQKVDGDAPKPTLISIDKNVDIELVGPTTEGGPHVHIIDDPQIGEKIKIFEDKAIFTQKIKLKKNTTVTGYVEAQVCDDRSCLAPETKDFKITVTLDGEAKKIDTTAVKPVSKESASGGGDNSNAGDAADSIARAAAATPAATDTDEISRNVAKMSAYYQNFFNKKKFADAVSGQKEEPISTWLAFILGFGGGLFALLTPCVFPMIPLTVSFFIKRGENKTKGRGESIFYGFSIMLIFFLLSLPFLIFNLSSNTLNVIATNLWVNIFFFSIFMVFAFSFFGYYEIALPSSLATKIDSASNVGGLIGIFFMALTLVIVSFSCTGPLIGTLLASLATSANGKLNLVVGMTSFGLAMGLPFTLFAFFPDLLKSLPKSGGWMDTVKKFFGFIELILALKFLSNADLEGHWGILKKEIFLGIWVILGAALFLYLIGLIKFKSESPINKRSPIRLTISALVLAFTLYCGYGLTGRDLTLLSGFIPPNYYSIFPKKSECPNDLSCFHDYDEALAQARKEHKPIFIDFTGYNCANCRKMEEKIWIDPEVYQRLSQKYIIVSLYVDDNRRKLPADMVYKSPDNGDDRTSYGDKWSDFQAICFNTNTQPQYVLISPDERRLTNPWNGFEDDSKKFKEFLDHGLGAFNSLQAK
ncbi:MAG: Thiol:disulfide interchange protein DsbD precursor [Bacteroidetes bacterium]|nr:Thiol:disulfide interchange protein DsbD precursor [Bacteroidota bacterium]